MDLLQLRLCLRRVSSSCQSSLRSENASRREALQLPKSTQHHQHATGR